MEKLKLISIEKILEKDFFIPAYQRGYRWEERQVLDLLEDLLEFQKKDKEKGEFYCLQPIVVIKREPEIYEVIDGQQRLTTLHILLSYLELARKIMFNSSKKFTISYETREKEKYSSKDFLNGIDNTKKVSNANVDFFHMSNTYLIIKNWFEEKNINKADFLNTLLKFDEKDNIDLANNVRFIWYELQTHGENDEKNIFTRINMGKIPLTSAELIKALFFINGSYTKHDREKHQQKISYEWNNIENILQNRAFWYFLNKSDNPKPTKIEFIFDLIANKHKEKVTIKLDKSVDTYYTFYVFNNLINNDIITKDVLWDEIKTYFRTFEEWYNNNEYYHLIGYLIHTGKNLEDIKELSDDKLKSEFKNELISMIKEDIESKFDKRNIEKLIELSYQDNAKLIYNILLLFNVITTMNSKYTKFPFARFIDEKWSLEHIHAQNSEDLKTDKQRKLLLKEQKMFFLINNDTEVVNSIDVLLNENELNIETFINLQDKIFAKYSEDIDIHSIDNMALLSTGDNSALNNNIFPVKRNKIIQLDEVGSFIPICTKNVFLKYFSNDVDQNYVWSKKDREAYLKKIEKTLINYLPNIN